MKILFANLLALEDAYVSSAVILQNSNLIIVSVYDTIVIIRINHTAITKLKAPEQMFEVMSIQA